MASSWLRRVLLLLACAVVSACGQGGGATPTAVPPRATTSVPAAVLFSWPQKEYVKYENCRFASLKCAVSGSLHTGADSKGSVEIIASGPGRVALRQTSTARPAPEPDHGMGNAVILEHRLKDGSTIYTLYAHLSEIAPGVQQGACLEKGAPIGKMGGSGYGTPTYWGVHLHFEFKTAPVLHNPSGAGTYYGYVPSNLAIQDLGFRNPEDYVDKVECLPCEALPAATRAPTVRPTTAAAPTATPPAAIPGATPKPNPTSVPATATTVLDTVLVQGLTPLYLTFDKAKWEAVPLGSSKQFYLKHRAYTNCELRGNEPRGVSFDWVRSDGRKTIAGSSYAVRTFSSKAGLPLMIIYYVSADEMSGVQVKCLDTEKAEKGAAPPASDKPELCLRDAEEVIALSAARSFAAR